MVSLLPSSLLLVLLFTGLSAYTAVRTGYEAYPSEMRMDKRSLDTDRDVLMRVLKRADDMQIYRRSQSQNILNRNRCFFSPVSCRK
ncbi:hypothetical protein PENTCL1PPCAC_23391 [Pristionchus entomophagus]|uniref:Uncharacterized protein n=1 Tax=Pristionchus entomophagus TaxID=358040 RepID=A0AAV5U3Z1_9BILA|nr:hypothetical protein PENTCL1PPCAC_23391 [Pristionchus entomophagus]